MRINVVPTLHGDDMAIRLLDRDTDLGSDGRDEAIVRRLESPRRVRQKQRANTAVPDAYGYQVDIVARGR